MLRYILLQSIAIFWVIVFLGSPVLAGEIKKGIEATEVLTLRSALARGIQHNLDLRVEELNIPITREEVTINRAEFDPVIEMGMSSQKRKTPTAVAFSKEDFDLYRETGGDVGIRKKFRFGLQSHLSFKSNRSINNSSVDALRPQYHSILLLDLTQPLLRDFGTGVNTANIRISRNQVRQAAMGYIDKAQRIGKEIEIFYYDLAEAQEALCYRIESRGLARDLLQGNREKFAAGLVPITEVQEAETALASRDEQVISAQQQEEIVANRLRDLLGIVPGEPLYKESFVTEDIPRENQTITDFEQALVIALKRRPDIRRQQLEISNRNIKLLYYSNQRLPRLDLKATLGANGLSGGDRPTSFAGVTVSSPQVGGYGDSLSRMSRAKGYEWYAGFRFSYPLGNRAIQAHYRRADLERRQAVYRLKRLEETAEKEVKNSLVTVKRSLERLTVAERFEKLSQTTLSQEMDRLKEGLSDTFHILRFQDDVVEARIRKAKALADFNRGLANLYRAMGTNLKRFDIVATIPEKGVVRSKPVPERSHGLFAP